MTIQCKASGVFHVFIAHSKDGDVALKRHKPGINGRSFALVVHTLKFENAFHFAGNFAYIREFPNVSFYIWLVDIEVIIIKFKMNRI